jgi:hypothetical protein
MFEARQTWRPIGLRITIAVAVGRDTSGAMRRRCQ